MKKSILSTILLSGLVLSVGATKALAAEEATATMGPDEKSEVKVKLTEDNGHEDGKGPFVERLAITHKPTTFMFEGEVGDTGLVLSNENKKKDQMFISVNDDRRDSTDNTKWISSEWQLLGKLGKLETSGTTKNELKAKLQIVPGALYKYDIGEIIDKGNGQQDYAPKAIDTANQEAAKADKYKVNQDITLIAGAADNIKIYESLDNEAQPKGERGVYANLGDAKLAIAAGNAKTKGDYSGTITWTLAAQ